jgi:hypothetical protein
MADGEQRHPASAVGYARAMKLLLSLPLVAVLLFPTTGTSQSLTATDPQSRKGAEKNAPVPKEYLPPPGMCRIWIDNVPANRQPAPTECATAIRNKPPNARVVFPPGRDGKADPQKLAPGRGRPDTTKRKPPA